jgi:hypothetical protein
MRKTAKTAVLPFFKTAKLQFSKSAVFQKPYVKNTQSDFFIKNISMKITLL